MSEVQEDITNTNTPSDAPPAPRPSTAAKRSGEVLFVGDAANASQQPQSLQDNFRRFREQKLKERQIMKLCQQASTANRRDAAYKDALREKFISTAKKYLGVPYALRYKNPEDPVAPLYLDCCGLVRQVLQDLQEDFGFVVGKWNQAYQMDTLPVALSFEQLRPGDLIFYEGTYTSPRSKPQKHNNVHVEIFLGGETGEATIGSRYHRGKVSIFPSYKFKSTTWDLVQFHFRSIDTWLEGVCRSCCPEHAWQSDALAYVEAAGRRSIFCDDNETEDVTAGGEEDDDEEEGRDNEGEGEREEEDGGDAASERQRESEYSYYDEEGGGGEGSETDECTSTLPAAVLGENTDSSRPPQPALSGRINSKACAGNATTKAAPQKRAKRISPYASAMSDKTEKTEKAELAVDGRAPRAVAGTLRDSRERTRAREKDTNKDSDATRTYYVGKSNGWRLVKAALDKRGWTQLPFDYQFTSRFGLKWVERRSQIDYRAHQAGQLVCHIPNNDVITTKLGLLTTMRDKFCRRPPGSAQILHAPWLPITYDLDSPADITALLKEAEDAANASAEREPIWIYKPSCNNRGRGIKVVSGVESLQLICHGKQTNDPETSIPAMKGIVQKYLETPLLIGPEGYKFDIRCYLLIARNFPHTIAFYHPGYCRLALKPYALGSADKNILDDTMMHLTNASVQKKDPIYQANKDLQIQSIADVANKMEQCGKIASAEYLRNQLDHDIKRCMVDILKAGNSKLLKKHGYFDLLGCDFMLSDDNQLFLLEINTNPALSLDNSVLEALLPDVVDGAIDLVLETQGPDVNISAPIGDFSNRPLPANFQLIFDEGTQWVYGK